MVLMSTYNGEEFIRAQIESVLRQKNINVNIFVRDDGSSDDTINILNEYQKQGKLKWYSGSNLGPAYSFLDLIKRAPDSDYYAFCDQDDVWNADKLKRACYFLSKMKLVNDVCLYCSDYQLVDNELSPILENGHVTTTKFEEAIVASCCTGCTVVFGRKLAKLVNSGNPYSIVMHDDWIHKLCLSVGGLVYYDSHKNLKYRQHAHNADGGVHSLNKRIMRIIERILTKDHARSEQLNELLRIYGDIMPLENVALLKQVVYYRNQSLLNRIKLIKSKKIKTPYERLNRGYRLAILFKYF